MIIDDGGGNNKFTMQMVVMAIAIIFLLPTMITVFVDHQDGTTPEHLNDVLDGYYSFTGATVTNENVWALTGIYTPYGIDANGNASAAYSYTPDHWLYGSRVTAYSPVQFTGSSIYTVNYDDGFYYYAGDTLDGHKTGELYTSVAMDISQKSDIFFTPSGKHTTDGGQWYYEYNGYRYAFQPLQDGYYKDQNGDIQKATASNTSLSMIFYDYYGSEGLSGQLTLSGSDQGLAYLTAQDIISAFDSTNNLAKFKMKFNGVDMNVYIKIKPEYTSAGYSVAQCFNLGFWEIMVTSISTNVNTYMSTDYSLNIENIWDTLIDLFTFNMDDYGLSSEMALIASLTISVCLYAALIAIISDKIWLIMFAGLIAIIQTIASIQFEIPDIWPFW